MGKEKEGLVRKICDSDSMSVSLENKCSGPQGNMK